MLMKHKVVTSTVFAVALAGSLHGQIIGDFEGSLDPGWVVTAGSGAPSTAWSSAGNYSLQLTPAGQGFSWGLQFNDLATVQALSTTHYLQFDVYWDSAQWQPDANADGWARWDQASLNSDATGWTQTTDANITDPLNPSYPGSWDPNNWGDSHQRTLTYDFTGLGFDTAGATWAQFNVAYNFGNMETIGNFYIDNVQLVLVPEPTSLALLGLTGVMLLIGRQLRRR